MGQVDLCELMHTTVLGWADSDGSDWEKETKMVFENLTATQTELVI